MPNTEKPKPVLTELSPPERRRAYVFEKRTIEFRDVRRIAVSASGYHRLETGDGKKYIVAPGWLMIELDVDDWTF